MIPTTEMDAREFGLHVRQGEWRLGLLVARNVAKGKGNPATTRQTSDTSANKVSARQFARVAGVNPNKVLRYLEAWDDAAEDGKVPPSSKLYPGKEVKLDVDKLPDWREYYSPIVEKTKSAPPRPIPPSTGKQVIGPESEVGWNPLYCAPNRTAHEFLRLLTADLSTILMPLPEGYHLNASDLEKLRFLLEAALVAVEKYEPLMEGESEGFAMQAVDKLPT